MWALYCLVQFYAVTHDELREIKPLAKFISFKAIVFATWWQGVAIAIICSPSILADAFPDGQTFQSGLQDFLICIEMAIAAVAHIFVFPAQPYWFMSECKQDSISVQSTTATVEIEKNSEKTSDTGEPCFVQSVETDVEGPGTSIRESFHDVVVGGGEHMVNDILITVSQAVEPVEKGVTKLNETLHHFSWGGKAKDNESKLEIDEQVSESTIENITNGVSVESHRVQASGEMIDDHVHRENEFPKSDGSERS